MSTDKQSKIEAQVNAEATGTEHELGYTIHCTFSPRGANEEQRRAMANLVRDKATEIQTFAALIAGPTQAVTTLTMRSSLSGTKALDFGYAL